MLVRVGAYYHDIGKLMNPTIFIENQTKIPDTLYTSMPEIKLAAKNIISHVSYGIELAKEYALPPQIMAFIAEHHGTTTTYFFLSQARKINPKISEKAFTYPGPKPLSVETALVMLADAIEAKLRLYHEIDKTKISEVVDEIISDRMRQKQLQLSGLTQDKIKRIRSSFIETLSTIHHQRISYPTFK